MLPRHYPTFFSLKPIKSSELNRLNPAYFRLTERDPFYPVPSVRYIWVLNQREEVIVGIEEPWKYPEAFYFNRNNPFNTKIWAHIESQLKQGVNIEEGDKLGHPTTAIVFLESETTTGAVEPGLCYLGGDLFYEQGHWHLNNRSGRFGRKHEKELVGQQQVECILLYVAAQFKRAGISVIPKLYFSEPHPHFSSRIYSGGERELLKQYGECAHDDLRCT